MTGLQTLNTCPQKWAAVVSGTVWKRWGLSPAGTLEAETVRGPLIVWASPKTGEKEDAPALEAPKPTPLDLRVWAVNTHKLLQSYTPSTWFIGVRREIYASRFKLSIFDREVLLGFIPKRSAFYGHYQKFVEDIQLGMKKALASLNSAESEEEAQKARTLLRSEQHFLLRFVRLMRGDFRVLFARLTRALQRVAYLAHVRRRVRPARRADRVPRPVHTRPRPPSAPLAPPVA